MIDDSAKSRLDIEVGDDLTKQLNDGRLSRRGLRERLAAIGVGFGAAFVLGLSGAQATPSPEATVALKSTNPSTTAHKPTRRSARRFSNSRTTIAGSAAGTTAIITVGDRA